MNKSTLQGFTLVELMITLLVAAILLALAVPGFQSLSQRSRQVNALNDMAAAVARARSEAVTRNREVVVCVSEDQSTCKTGSEKWETGWIAFVDSDRNGQRASEETLLFVGQPLPAGMTMRSSGFDDVVDRLTIIAGSGLIGSGSGEPGTLRICDSRGPTNMGALNISGAGQVRFAVDTNGDGYLEDTGAAELTDCT